MKITDKQYPALLKEISDPPKTLHIRGDQSCLRKPCIAIIGTRKPSSYGIRVTKDLCTELVACGFVIVSGMAFGIDSIAHATTIASGGKTIAVLGSSVDDESLYPRSNIKLAHNIAKHGLLVSELPRGTRARAYSFPIRNRIISGLSVGVVVIEAQQKSGTLITANHAAHQNRDVFAIPGSIHSPTSTGTHWLIQHGAKLVTHIDDILEELSHLISRGIMPISQIQTYHPSSKDEKIILNNLTSNPKYIDLIKRHTNIPIPELLKTLTLLESRGIVVSHHGDFYISNKYTIT